MNYLKIAVCLILVFLSGTIVSANAVAVFEQVGSGYIPSEKSFYMALGFGLMFSSIVLSKVR